MVFEVVVVVENVVAGSVEVAQIIAVAVNVEIITVLTYIEGEGTSFEEAWTNTIYQHRNIDVFGVHHTRNGLTDREQVLKVRRPCDTLRKMMVVEIEFKPQDGDSIRPSNAIKGLFEMSRKPKRDKAQW